MTTAIPVENKKTRNALVRELYTSILKKITSGELTRAQIIGLVGLFILILGILVQTTLFPSILASKVQEEFALKQDSFRRQYWSKLPLQYELRTYLFNVTNPDEIDAGGKPILKEIGPFVYDVVHEKINLIDDEENDAVSYSVNNNYYFNTEKSNNLSDDIELVGPAMHTFGTANAVVKDHAALLPMAEKAVDSVGRNPQSLFVKLKVKTFLFDGQIFSCEGIEDLIGRLYCKDVRSFYSKYRMVKRTDDLYVFSMFGQLNETTIYHGVTRIRRGNRNMIEIGRVIEYNGLTNISIWKNDECNKFRGTDGTMFHPYLNKKKNKYLFVTNTYYCRNFIYKYESEVELNGLKLLRYTTSMGTNMETAKEDKCYCIAPDRCLKNGVFEIWRCFNNAFILSNPHFYLADKSYVNGVEGIKPIKDKHMIILDIEPLTGVVVRSHFRMQYNMLLMNLEKYRWMKNVRDALFPFLWSDEVMILPDYIVKRIKKIHRMITIAKVISYILIIIGLVICAYALFCEYKSRSA